MQDGSKAPQGSWKDGQAHRAGEAQLEAWYSRGLTGVGWITGAVSGGLEVLDFDDRSVWALFQRFCADAGLQELLDRMIAGYLEYSPNGAHLVYRCSAIEGNQKLAMRAMPGSASKWKSIIETRGEGGFIIVAPSHGSVNANGRYELKSGDPSTIPTITPEERAGLFMVAKTFDESLKVTDERRPVRTGAGERPGDSFNARASWAEVLEPHGWVRVFSSGGKTSWRRPGKEQGISATTGHAGTDLLYVFSTSTVFESGRGFSKFSAYGILNHGGDFSEASRTLGNLGYGLELPHVDPGVDTSEFLRDFKRQADAMNVQPEAEAPAFDTLMKVPGAVGELAEWIDAGSKRSQPTLALGAAIAALSAVIGRKVQTETGLRPNIYVLGIGETGCGKDQAREAIGNLFEQLGIGNVLGDAFASGASIETAIERHPVRLFLIDEIGHLLGTMKDARAESHLKDIVPVLLRMYSASSSVYRKREFASKDADAVATVQPSLSIYGTTVPSNLYGNLTKAHVQNGLLSRLLVFESTDRYPALRLGSSPAPAKSLLDVCKAWIGAPMNANPDAGDIEKLTNPDPYPVPWTDRARRVFEDLEQSMRRRIEKIWQTGGEQGPYTRVVATALKLALVRACGVSATNPEITEDDAVWGSGMAWRLTEDLATRVAESAPENKVEEAGQRVAKLIAHMASEGIIHSELVRKTRWLSGRQLSDTLKALMEAGDITAEQIASGGRPRTIYKAVT